MSAYGKGGEVVRWGGGGRAVYRMNKMNTEYLTITLQIRIRIIAPHPDPTNSSAKSGSKCITKYEDLNRLQSPPCEEMAKTEVD